MGDFAVNYGDGCTGSVSGGSGQTRLKGSTKNAPVMSRVGHQKFIFYHGMCTKEEQWEIVRIFNWPLGHLVSNVAGFCLGRSQGELVIRAPHRAFLTRVLFISLSTPQWPITAIFASIGMATVLETKCVNNISNKCAFYTTALSRNLGIALDLIEGMIAELIRQCISKIDYFRI